MTESAWEIITVHGWTYASDGYRDTEKSVDFSFPPNLATFAEELKRAQSDSREVQVHYQEPHGKQPMTAVLYTMAHGDAHALIGK